MSLPEEHRNETERLIRLRSKTDLGKEKIGEWLLNEGYYPEQYVLPPCFEVNSFSLNDFPNISDLRNLSFGSEKQIGTISFPKSNLIQRVFGIIQPKYYHDIVYYFIKSWDELIDILFNPENQIYSYSFPIPLSSADAQGVGKLRSGRMIYEFLEMAEKDLVAESHRYKFLAKIDITNFYNSVYTHSIAWAWYGDRKKAGRDGSNYNELGNQLDKLFQYSNDARTSGLPVGPVVSDLVVELLLCNQIRLSLNV
ncbi:RNA-directed DNA polymerase [Rhodohalobacter sp.]|uniref:RNA-directed DNA polymerase n=1 Tax=Rhodohalobacter sp. TaxID=1974210 RepID=UPI002ACDD98B|nr:RNA-directed DNA polymerase [Rhodohalobacter sp.]MDZ7757768.1 RNA-directed DNA polymerase [Rhodohalobacter sp.]